jgi:hypothetical protein
MVGRFCKEEAQRALLPAARTAASAGQELHRKAWVARPEWPRTIILARNQLPRGPSDQLADGDESESPTHNNENCAVWMHSEYQLARPEQLHAGTADDEVGQWD